MVWILHCENCNKTTTTISWPFVWDYPCESVPEEIFTHSHLSWSSTIRYQLPPSTTIHSINLHAWQVFFAQLLSKSSSLSLGQEPSTSYSIHFFTQTYQDCHLFLVSLSQLYSELFTLMSHIHLTILITAGWSVTSFSFLTGQVSLPCSILLCTQLLYSLPLIIYKV